MIEVCVGGPPPCPLCGSAPLEGGRYVCGHLIARRVKGPLAWDGDDVPPGYTVRIELWDSNYRQQQLYFGYYRQPRLPGF